MDTHNAPTTPAELFTAARCVTCTRPVFNLFAIKCADCIKAEDDAYEAEKRALQAKLDAEIVTDPCSGWEWRAWIRGTEDEGMLYGHGRTEEAAIDDLMGELLEQQAQNDAHAAHDADD